MKSGAALIQEAIGAKQTGQIFTPNDFRGLGTDKAIRNTLSRLAKDGSIRRIAHGIYYIPKTDPVLGEMVPGVDQIVQAFVEKDKIRVRPTGSYALNQLGLSTQVQTRIVYLTDGKPRQIKVGKKMIIRFKQTTPKKMSMEGPLSSLLLVALEELDLAHVRPDMERRIQDILKKESPELLQQDLRLASARVHDYIVNLLKKMHYDGMAAA